MLLSKFDLMSQVSLPAGLTPVAAGSMLRSQYLAATMEAVARRGSTGSTVPDVGYLPFKVASSSLAINLLGDTSEDGITDTSDMILREVFPELDVDDQEATKLSDAVYICLTLFCSSSSSILSKRGAIPIAKWQKGMLSLADHLWLNELPQPLPNPSRVRADVAARMGKDSPDATRSNFWCAMCTLSEQLGSFEPETLGSIHTAPLLTTSGALMVVVRCDYPIQAGLGSNPRRLSWQPIARIATKIAKVSQAAELQVTDTTDSNVSSYACQVKEMLANTPSRELMPSVWLEKLRTAHEMDTAATESLTPGTYMVAFYTQSTMTGLRALLPQKGLTSLPPCVKISEQPISAQDWNQICEMDGAMASGSSEKVPRNWADAKAWMGPDLGSEAQFSMVQKFFYGVTALRQRLEVRCNAMREELRYSSVSGAIECLGSLGQLYKKEVVIADPEGKVHLLIVCKHYTFAGLDTFPSSMTWHPFPICEARVFRHFWPIAQQKLSTGKDLLLSVSTLQERTLGSRLRGSNLRSSGSSAAGGSLRGSRLSCRSSMNQSSFTEITARVECDSNLGLVMRPTPTTLVTMNEQERVALQEAWDPLRWTKRVVLTMVSEGLALAREGMPVPPTGLQGTSGSDAKVCKLSAQQRIDLQTGTYKQVLQDLDACQLRLRHAVKQLMPDNNDGAEGEVLANEQSGVGRPTMQASCKMPYAV